MKIAYAGIDLAFAKGKKLPLCACTLESGQLVPLPLTDACFPLPPIGRGNPATIDDEAVASFARQALAYLEEVERVAQVEIQSVAIDAPRAFSEGPRRACEQAMDRMGISCFATPSREKFVEIKAKVRAHLAAGGEVSRLPHAQQLWMLVGFKLFEVLSERYECLEVFPQATVRVLGAAGTHKSKDEGLQRQLSALASCTGWETGDLKAALSRGCHGPFHDRLDAYMCTWISSLYPDKVTACGDPPEDVIWVPQADVLRVASHPLPKPAAARKMISVLGSAQPRKEVSSIMQSDKPLDSEFANGQGKTTQIGYVNRNDQRCLGTRGARGTDHCAQVFKLECLNGRRGHIYGANGTDVFHRKCPRCQGGAAGIAF